MLKCGDIRPIRMTPLQRLLELLRIAQQYEVLRGLRRGDYISQRHPPRFVADQYIDGILEFIACPEPCSSRDNVCGPVAERLQRLTVVFDLANSGRRVL